MANIKENPKGGGQALKHKIKVWVSFLVFLLSIFLLFGIMGSCELDYITVGQAAKRGAICLIVLGADAVWVSHLWEVSKRKLSVGHAPENGLQPGTGRSHMSAGSVKDKRKRP
jgi:hypothetical protein